MYCNKLPFCQDDYSPMEESFWQKESLITKIRYDSAPRPQRSCFAHPKLYLQRVPISKFQSVWKYMDQGKLKFFWKIEYTINWFSDSTIILLTCWSLQLVCLATSSFGFETNFFLFVGKIINCYERRQNVSSFG